MFQFLNLVILVHFNHSLSKTVFVLHTDLKRKELFFLSCTFLVFVLLFRVCGFEMQIRSFKM